MSTNKQNMEVLRELLAKANIKQKDIAQRAQVSPPSISQVIHGRSRSKHIEAIIRKMLEENLGASELEALDYQENSEDEAGESNPESQSPPPLSVSELKELMDQTNLKQRDIAKKAKVSPAAVSLVVSGKSKSKRIEKIIRREAAKVEATTE